METTGMQSRAGAQTQNLGFCPAGSGAEECRAGMAQVGIAMVPELTRVCVAGKGRVLRSAAYPVESAAQFAGDAGKVIGREASAFRQALAASYRSPETPVGEAIVGFGAVERVGQLILGDVTD